MTLADERRMDDFPASESHAGGERPGPGLDPHDLAHGVIDGLFALVFPDPSARLRLGLRALSRAPTVDMRWYVWSAHRPGALALEMLPDDGGAPDAATFAIRYYPALDEPLLARFSPAERACRAAGAFDETGTPGLGREDEVAATLFLLGLLEIAPEGPNGLSLVLRAPERGLEFAGADDGEKPVRDVPALELALALWDPMVSGLAFLGRRPPARVRAWRRQGVALHAGPDGRLLPLPAAQSPQWTIEAAGLAMPGRAAEFDGGVGPEPRGPEPDFRYEGLAPPPHAPWPVNPQWWRAAGWTFDPVGTFCGECAAEGEPDGHSHRGLFGPGSKP